MYKIFIEYLPIIFVHRTFTDGRQGDLLGQMRPGGGPLRLRHSPSPVPAAANNRPPTINGPSNDASDATDAADPADGTEGGRGGGGQEDEPNCPVQ